MVTYRIVEKSETENKYIKVSEIDYQNNFEAIDDIMTSFDSYIESTVNYIITITRL